MFPNNLGGGSSFYDAGGNLGMNVQMPDWNSQLMALLAAKQASGVVAKKPLLGSGSRSSGGMGVSNSASPANHSSPSALAALFAEKNGAPVFTKTVGGPGMMAGNIRLNAWEPGAAFAGYEKDLGSGPKQSSFGGSIPPSAAALGPSSQGVPGQYNAGYQPQSMYQSGRPAAGLDFPNFDQQALMNAYARSEAEWAARQGQR